MGFKKRSTAVKLTPEATHAAIVARLGEDELSKIGDLLYQLGDGSEAAAGALLRRFAAMSCSVGEYLDLAAVAIGIELADMGQRGGFLMNVTYGATSDSDMGDLISEADSAVDPYSLGPPLLQALDTLLQRDGHAASAASDLGEPGRARFTILHDSFERAVRPRLLACIERHQRER